MEWELKDGIMKRYLKLKIKTTNKFKTFFEKPYKEIKKILSKTIKKLPNSRYWL